ncbi:MAG: hypothetical protein CMF96_09500, partial [Candidatus Marinimicrobia bacterium]|nr:hypothetical protein [Candidatus Neomarinimicrobiota bacterium]
MIKNSNKRVGRLDMGNKFLTLIIAFCYSIVFGSIELSFNNYSESNGTADVVYSSSVEIGGFQIGLLGGSLSGASGGAAAENGFTMSSSSTTLLGFSFSGATIPAGNGILATLSFESTASQICLDSPVISTGSGSAVDVFLVNSCVGDIPPVVGCSDPQACNFDENATAEGECLYPETNYDCNGNCLINEDCNGDCGGLSVVDACGVCGGDSTDPDACGVPVYYSSSEDFGGFQFS